MSELPSGAQYEITSGEQRAVIVEVGGGIRSYEVAGEPLLDGYAEAEMMASGRGAVLAPWPNRVADGSYELDGLRYQLALTEPDKHHAIHGLVRWANWTCAARQGDLVRMALTLHGQPGYPFVVSFEAEYRLTSAGLTIAVTARNQGEQRAPYAIGHHPYLTAGTEHLDECRLTLPAASYLELNDRLVPTGMVLPVEGTELDFRQPRAIGDLRLDTPFADISYGADGLGRVTLEGRRRVTLWFEPVFGWLQVFTGDTVVPESRRRQGLGVEPMTSAPDAFNNRLGFRVLEPGESLTTRWGVAIEG